MQFSFTQVAGAIFAVATAASAATWYIRGEQIDVLKQTVEAYEISNDLNLNELSKNVLSATSKLSYQLDRAESIDELKDEITSIEGQLKEEKALSFSQKEVIGGQAKELSTMKIQIESLFSDYQQFSMAKNSPIKLYSAKYVLSIESISSTGVWIYLNNNLSSMAIGNYKELNNGESDCKIFLESIVNNSKANFSILCDVVA